MDRLTEMEAFATVVDEGGFTDAGVRVALIGFKRGGNERRLSTLKQIRELVGYELGLLAMPSDVAQAIIRR